MPPTSKSLVLYMHIPKAAGTTVSGVLFDCLKNEDASDEENGHLMSGVYYYPRGFVAPLSNTARQEARRVLSRKDLKAVLGHFHFGIHKMLPAGATYITVMRTPVERFLSLFYFHKLVQQRWGALEGCVLPDNMTLEEFVRAAPYKELDNGQTRRISGCDPEIGRCTHAMLAQAKQNLRKHFSVVGTTCRLEETLVLMQRRFGWKTDLQLYPQNVNPSRPATNSLPSAIRAAVVSRNALDIELHEFAASLLEEAILAGSSSFFEDVKRLKASNAQLTESGAARPTEG